MTIITDDSPLSPHHFADGHDPLHGHHPVVRQVKHDLTKKPFIVIWEVTRACQLACKHCRAEAFPNPDPRQLTTAEGKQLLDQLASYDPPRPLVVFSGGDAFERKDLTELVQYGTDHGLSMSLSPSVTPLFTRERLAELRAAGGKAMSVSLDGATAATHDAFRGFSGTFDATVRAASWINEAGFRLQVNSTLTKDNIHEAPALMKTVMEMNAKLWYIFFLVPTGRGAALRSLNPEEREDVLHWLHDVSDRIAIKTTEAPQYRRVALERDAARAEGRPLPERGELHRWLTEETTRLLGDHARQPRPPRAPLAVNSGSGFAFVDHIGDVYPSGFLPIHCGNVRDTPFPEIYRDAPIMRQLRDPQHFHGKCGACEYNSLCGGSRSTAYAVTGDPLAADPTCVHIPAGWDGPVDLLES